MKRKLVTETIITPRPNTKYFDVKKVMYVADLTEEEIEELRKKREEEKRKKKLHRQAEKTIKRSKSIFERVPIPLAILILIMYFLYIIKTFYPQIWECFETLMETGSFI